MANPWDNDPIVRPSPVIRPGEEAPRARGQRPAPPAKAAPQQAQPVQAMPWDNDPVFEAPQASGPVDIAQPEILTSREMGQRVGNRFAQPMIGNDEVSTLEDAYKAGRAGIGRGAVGLLTLPGNLETLGRMGINAAARGMGAKEDLVSRQSALPNYGTVMGAIEEQTGDWYRPRTKAGQYANTIGEFGTGALFPGTLAQRALVNVLTPAVASETAGQFTEGTRLEPWARIAGALTAPAVMNAGMRTVSPLVATPQRSNAVKTLEGEGVTALTAGQRTGSERMKYLEDSTQHMTGGGNKVGQIYEKQAEQFTQATLRRAGVDAPRATPEVMDQAFANAGQRFDDLAKSGSIKFDQPLANKVRGIANEYERMTPKGQHVAFVKEFADEVANLAAQGKAFMGDRYQAYRSALEAAAKRASDPDLKFALRDFKSALDDAVEKSLPAAMKGEWAKVRRDYRNLLTVERAVSAAGADAAQGLISPQALRTATKVQNTRAYVRGKDDMGDLARAGVTVMTKPPQSGTAPRLQMQHLVQAAVGGAAGGQAIGGAEGGAIGALAPFVLQGMLARGVMSRPVQRYMGNQALPQSMEISRRTMAPTVAPNALFATREDR